MQVKLLAYTPSPEATVACAAKLCYAQADIGTVQKGLTPEKAASFLEMLSEIGHESPIEHASFTFGIEGVSRSLLAQITRHRIASYSVQSQRYVKEDSFEFVLPPEIEALPERNSCGPWRRTPGIMSALPPFCRKSIMKPFCGKGRSLRPPPGRQRKRPLRTRASCCPMLAPPSLSAP